LSLERRGNFPLLLKEGIKGRFYLENESWIVLCSSRVFHGWQASPAVQFPVGGEHQREAGKAKSSSVFWDKLHGEEHQREARVL
ncbi:MAG: hypothetical protein KAX39_08660, partial [candidate division Zixibacteria bacterium]|nr:hypothetical protein [candidate division Zixibacteria bacterium]